MSLFSRRASGSNRAVTVEAGKSPRERATSAEETHRRILVICGYFDWFSGYQEVALTTWLAKYAAVEVIASDRVSPMFSDDHLAKISVSRRYAPGGKTEHGVFVKRFASSEFRSMVWARGVRRYIQTRDVDLIVQAMPGQLLPFAGTIASNPAARAVLFGDNSAMWSHLTRFQRLLKWAGFTLTKGGLYALASRRADASFGFTPDTVNRLRHYSGGKRLQLLPLSFDPTIFKYDSHARASVREQLGYTSDNLVIVSAGKFQEKKRLDILVAAFRSVAISRPHLRLLLAGADDGSYAAALRAAVQSDPVLLGRVDIMGFVGAVKLNGVLNAADIGVWPSMPAITIQQGLGSGLYILLPRNEWVGHLLRDGCGRYFRDGEQLEAELAAVLEESISVDYSESARVERAKINAWLGADRIALDLLAAFDRGKIEGSSDMSLISAPGLAHQILAD